MPERINNVGWTQTRRPLSDTFPMQTLPVNCVYGAADFPDAELCWPSVRQRSPEY